MSKVSSSLPDEEWTRFELEGEARLPFIGGVRKHADGVAIWRYGQRVDVPRESLPALIAVANASLPSDDPRRITRHQIETLREAAKTQATAVAATGSGDIAQRMLGLADALEAFLRPIRLDHDADSQGCPNE